MGCCGSSESAGSFERSPLETKIRNGVLRLKFKPFSENELLQHQFIRKFITFLHRNGKGECDLLDYDFGWSFPQRNGMYFVIFTVWQGRDMRWSVICDRTANKAKTAFSWFVASVDSELVQMMVDEDTRHELDSVKDGLGLRIVEHEQMPPPYKTGSVEASSSGQQYCEA